MKAKENRFINNLKKLKEIHTERLIIRPFKETDLEDIFEYASDKKVVHFFKWPAHKNIEETKTFFYKTIFNQPGLFAIETEKKCIGSVEININTTNHKASIGYVLNRNYWNQGYMTEALNKMIEVCFNDLKLNRIEAAYLIGNDASGRVMKKCGMKLEGINKESVRRNNQYYHMAHYGLIKKDWLLIDKN